MFVITAPVTSRAPGRVAAVEFFCEKWGQPRWRNFKSGATLCWSRKASFHEIMATNALATITLSLELLLPVFGEFAQKGDLDVTVPLTTNRVTKYYAGKKTRSFMATLDGRHQFNWNSTGDDPHKGTINYYDRRLCHSFASPRDKREWAKQPSLISTTEAREIAERFLTRCGFNLNRIRVQGPISGEYVLTENPNQEPELLPVFGFRWVRKGVKEPQWHDVLVEVEVSGLTRKVVCFTSSPEADKAMAIDLRNYRGLNRKADGAPPKTEKPKRESSERHREK